MMTDAFLRIEKLLKGKVEGFNQWDEIPLGMEAILIARPDKEPDAIMPEVKIVGDDYVSRTPTEIFYSLSDGCHMIRDHGSTNGTFLNGEPIEKDGRAYPLKDYDMIGLAKIQGEMRVVLRFRISHKTKPGWVSEESWKPSATTGLSVNLAARRVFVDSRDIPLTRTEWKIFEVLHANRDRVCTMDDITWEVWGAGGATPELVAKYIQRLRDKIEPDRAKPRYIVTHSTGGYCLQL